MDHDMDGNINFEEFVVLLSVLARGTLDEKLQWVFNLYDFNGDGCLTVENMVELGTSVYEMLGKCTEPPIHERSVKERIAELFAVSTKPWSRKENYS